jgi:hypothetical protein
MINSGIAEKVAKIQKQFLDLMALLKVLKTWKIKSFRAKMEYLPGSAITESLASTLLMYTGGMLAHLAL